MVVESCSRTSVCIARNSVDRYQSAYNENRRIMLIPGPASSYLQNEVAQYKDALLKAIKVLTVLKGLSRQAQRGLTYLQNGTPTEKRKLPYFEDGGNILKASHFINLALEQYREDLIRGYKVKTRTNHN